MKKIRNKGKCGTQQSTQLKKKKKRKKEEAKPNSILGRIKYSKTPPNQCWETYIMPFSQRLPLKENEIKSRRK